MAGVTRNSSCCLLVCDWLRRLVNHRALASAGLLLSAVFVLNGSAGCMHVRVYGIVSVFVAARHGDTSTTRGQRMRLQLRYLVTATRTQDCNLYLQATSTRFPSSRRALSALAHHASSRCTSTCSLLLSPPRSPSLACPTTSFPFPCLSCRPSLWLGCSRDAVPCPLLWSCSAKQMSFTGAPSS